MAFIDTVPASTTDASVLAMYRRQQEHWGYLPNYAKVFSHRPEVLVRWGRLLAEIRRHLPPREFELATLVAAHALGNSACALAHARALRDDFSHTQLIAILTEPRPDCLGPAEQALVAFARQVAVDATAVTAADVAALRKVGFSDAQVFDLAATVAGRVFFTRLLDALGVLPDRGSACFPPALLEHLLVGRQPDTAAEERLPG